MSRTKRAFIWVGVISFIYHILMVYNLYDDAVYRTTLDRYSYIGFMNYFYSQWSSRLLVFTPIIFLIRVPLVWAILDALMFASFPILLCRIVGCKDREVFFCCIMVLLYPFEDMKGAGWITTAGNYIWVMWAILVAGVILCKYLHQEKLAWYEYIIGAIAIIYASNFEQGTVVILFMLLGCVACLLYYKRFQIWYVYICLALNISSLLFILYCPGNAVRVQVEAQRQGLTTFTEMSLINKALIGLLYIERVFIAVPNRIWIVFCVLLFVSTCVLIQKKRNILIASIPLIIMMGYFVVGTAFRRYAILFPVSGEIFEIDYANPMIYLQLLYLLMSIGSVIYTLYWLLEKNRESFYFILVVLAGGMAATIAVAMSASLYASGFRIFIFLYFALIYTSVACVKRISLIEKIPKDLLYYLRIALYGWCGLNVIYVACMCYAAGRLS